MNIKDYIQKSINIKQLILNDEKILNSINEVAVEIINAYQRKNKVLLAGNGGSAADAQHIASELVSKLFIKRLGLNAFALTTNSSIITSISNDYGYDEVFAKQIEAGGEEGDIFIGISTSGTSKNIINAFKEAKRKKIISIGLTGKKITETDNLCNYVIKVPSDYTPIIQEAHIMIGHILCAIIEEQFFKG